MSHTRIGFIGLGNVGANRRQLLRHGIELTVRTWNHAARGSFVRPWPARRASPAELAGVDMVITCLPRQAVLHR